MRHRLATLLAVASVASVISGCATVVAGTAVSVNADAFHVAGLPVTEERSGLRTDAPGPTREAENGDGGSLDNLVLSGISDLEEFWAGAYKAPLEGEFEPVDALLSWDYYDANGPEFCGRSTFEYENAAFCPPDNLIGWDRGKFMRTVRQHFGDMAVVAIAAHEYGHALQYQAYLVDRNTSSIVAEQQADCFSGVYLRWVAEGNSKRFTLNTGEGLNKVLAALVAVRDPTLDEDTRQMKIDNEHGSAFERISAFQFGFTDGVAACAAIDDAEIEQRRGGMPLGLQDDENGELNITKESVTDWVNALTTLFKPADPPKLVFDIEDCDDAARVEPVGYCPATNTIGVDLPALQRLGTKNDDMSGYVFGDNTAYSVLTSRYMLAVQKEHGDLVLDNDDAALRTACLTGVATTKFSGGAESPGGPTLTLSAGDLDEAVSGLLTNGLAASDVNGKSVPAGFSRVDAFRSGVLGEADNCYERFP